MAANSHMDSTLEEFFADALADAAMYNDDNFEAFESDEDSMLILGQPIDDQITTRNIASFAIPQREHGDGTLGSEEECEYEDSFESPTKSPIQAQHLSEMSSITFMHSKADPSLHGFPPVIYDKPTAKKKGKKKRKRVPPAASLAATVPQSIGGDVHPEYTSHESRRNGPATQHMPDISGTAASRQGVVPSTGSRAGARGYHTPRTSSAGPGMSQSSAVHPSSAARGISSGSSRATSKPSGSFVPNSRQPQHFGEHDQMHAEAHHRILGTPLQQQYAQRVPTRPSAAAASVVSQVTVASNVGRHQGAAYSNAILQRQLDNALKQVSIYRRENEALQQNLDSAGINEAVERYKALLIEKENRIVQLVSENNGLKSIARYQGKYLAEQATQPTGTDSAQHHEKQIEIMLVHTRKMKEKAKKLEEREQELVAENERLQTQNGRIQRKNMKLKKQVIELTAALQSGTSAKGPEQGGAISTSILDALDSAEGDRTEHSPADSTGDLNIHQGSRAGATSLETISTGASTAAAGQGGGGHAPWLGSAAKKPPGGGDSTAAGTGAVTATTGPMTKAALRRALDERDMQLRKQQLMIETLERSLQTQRGRFAREIELLKQQATQAVEEQKRLEVELDKRERFGRNQVTLAVAVLVNRLAVPAL
jgi:regulator of replication initiation timing